MNAATDPTTSSILPQLGPVMALWSAGMPSSGPFSLSLPLAAEDDRPLARRPSLAKSPQGIAVIDVRGLLVKDPDLFTDLGLATSTMEIARQVQAAAHDPNIRAILLAIDSPGGSAAGTAEAAAVIRAAARRKMVHAHVEAIGASAAYRLASQAGSISAATDALVGSIGTYSVVADTSQLAERLGITVHVLRAGAMKGAGTPGTVITAEQLADFQRTVEAINETFLADVAAGRKLAIDRVRELADGRVHVGAAAQQLRLIDMMIPTTDEVLAMIDQQAPRPAPKPTNPPMSDWAIEALTRNAQGQYVPAAELAEAFQHAINQRIAAGAGRWLAVGELQHQHPDAYAAWAQRQPAQRIAPPADNRPSIAAMAEQYNQLVAMLIAARTARHEAHRQASQQRPDLHSAWLAKANPRANVQLINRQHRPVPRENFRD